jgi:hypothetical protein
VDGRPVTLQQILVRALHPDPLVRYRQARALITALEPFVEDP